LTAGGGCVGIWKNRICVMMNVHQNWDERGGLRALMTLGLVVALLLLAWASRLRAEAGPEAVAKAIDEAKVEQVLHLVPRDGGAPTRATFLPGTGLYEVLSGKVGGEADLMVDVWRASGRCRYLWRARGAVQRVRLLPNDVVVLGTLDEARVAAIEKQPEIAALELPADERRKPLPSGREAEMLPDGRSKSTLGVNWETLAHKGSIPLHLEGAFARLGYGDLTGPEGEFKEIASAPGLAPVLMELFERLYAETAADDYMALDAVMQVLRLRQDLSEKELGVLRKKLEGVWDRPDDAKSVTLKSRGLRILAQYQGRANEEVLLKYLQESQTIFVLGHARNAADGLGEIGTSRSLAALETYQAQQEAGSGRQKEAAAAVAAVRKRGG
jgi:hypothetical protein